MKETIDDPGPVALASYLLRGILDLVYSLGSDIRPFRTAEMVAVFAHLHRRNGDVVDRYLACTSRYSP
jgi:hypothetical protein